MSATWAGNSPRLERWIAVVAPAYAVRRARARRQLAAERIAAEIAARPRAPRPPRPPLLPPFDVIEGYRIPRR
jgi:hypothetical protein